MASRATREIRHTDARRHLDVVHMKYGGQDKTEETNRDRTLIPISDALNAPKVQDYGRQCMSHNIAKQHR